MNEQKQNDTERGGQGDSETDNEKGESDQDREVEAEPVAPWDMCFRECQDSGPPPKNSMAGILARRFE
jgi:hypothetical protein